MSMHMGSITGRWQCKDCPEQIDYTASIVDSDVMGGVRVIRAVIDNDQDLRDHADTHGHERGAKPLTLVLTVKL